MRTVSQVVRAGVCLGCCESELVVGRYILRARKDARPDRIPIIRDGKSTPSPLLKGQENRLRLRWMALRMSRRRSRRRRRRRAGSGNGTGRGNGGGFLDGRGENAAQQVFLSVPGKCKRSERRDVFVHGHKGSYVSSTRARAALPKAPLAKTLNPEKPSPPLCSPAFLHASFQSPAPSSNVY